MSKITIYGDNILYGDVGVAEITMPRKDPRRSEFEAIITGAEELVRANMRVRKALIDITALTGKSFADLITETHREPRAALEDLTENSK